MLHVRSPYKARTSENRRMNRALRREPGRLLIAALLAVGMGVAYVSSARPLPVTPQPTCASASAANVRWIRVSSLRERSSLDRWCSGVGPPARIEAARRGEAFPSSFVLVSWNAHVGGGDIDRFVGDLRAGRITGRPQDDFILLLQEVYRAGDSVPSADGAEWAAAEQPGGPHATRVDVTAAAARLGLSAIYVPSMRNGRPGTTSEDRGNAILSTRPLSDVTAIELPLERQRRVAIATTVLISGTDPAPRAVRIICTHFTNMVMHHLWLLSETGRLRQARALAETFPTDTPLVIGGDFNAWFGFRDAAYKELANGMSPGMEVDRRPTFGPLRLDHVLFRLPDGWRTRVRRGEDKYGSDHFPLIASIDAR